MKTFFKIDIKFLLLIILLISLINLSMGVYATENNSKVLFDETGPYGKYYTIYNAGPAGSSGFASLLENNGYSISRLTEGPLTYEKLKDYDVLVMMGPMRSYSDQEINSIKEFVKNGGGLFILADPWGPQDGDENYAFNKVARSFGVNFAFNQVMVDKQHNIAFSNQIKTTGIKSHPVTSNISELYYITGAYQDSGSANVMAYSDADSWSDHGYVTSEGTSQNDELKESDEKQGPLPLISSLEYGKGKIVFMGSVQTFMNAWIYRSGGWKLGLNTVSWLSDKPVPTTYNTASIVSLNIGDMLYRILGLVFFGIIIVSSLFMKLRKGMKNKGLRPTKIIKSWKYKLLIAINAFFIVIAVLMFFPINIYLFDMSVPALADPDFGHTLLIVGILFLAFASLILYTLLIKQRISEKYSYINIGIALFFAGLTILIGDLFSFPIMAIFTLGSFLLIIPLLLNLWFARGYGDIMIVEGKEFNRLEKMSFKSLPYELQGIYSDPLYIGEGGFGRVFKAKRKDGEDIAIKIPKSFDKKSEKTFIWEVSNWSHLNHPNIVKLHDFKILPIPFIEMEFCEEFLSHDKKPLKNAINIIYDIAKGLQYAHNQNIIHGDVKTSNIMMGNGIYKISDWGLSKLKSGDSVTLSGATPQYAAPEQISYEFGKADERTDIYQLGTVFYELVTGVLPFEGEIAEIYGSILNTIPIKPSEIDPKASEVEHIIMKCLNKNKEQRYSSMGELIEELKKYMEPEDKTMLLDKEL